MSSILKALKKIEQDSSPVDELPSWPHPIDQKKAVNARAKKRWFSYKLATIVLIIILLLTAGWLLKGHKELIVAKVYPLIFSESSDNDMPIAPIQSQQSQSNVKSKSAGPEQLAKRSIQLPNNPQKPITVRKPIIKQNVKKQSDQKPPAKYVADRRPNKPTVPDPAASDRIYKNNAPPTASKNSIVASKSQNTSAKSITRSTRTSSRSTRADKTNPSTLPSSTVPKPQRARKPVTLDRLEDSKLELQAIAWSDDAAKRMVVINGRIVREGESIDGFSVTEIRQDDVVVNDGSKSWMLEFGLRRVP